MTDEQRAAIRARCDAAIETPIDTAALLDEVERLKAALEGKENE